MDISKFCQMHQRHFGTDASFFLAESVDLQGETRGYGPQHAVRYGIKTSFGTFYGSGNGKKQAREAAVQAASQSEDCPFKN